jgi:hypothetical protein
MITLLLGGIATAPDVGTTWLGHVVVECQSSNPLAKCGQLVRNNDRFDTMGCGIVIRSEYPDVMYCPNGGLIGDVTGMPTGVDAGMLTGAVVLSLTQNPHSHPRFILGKNTHDSEQTPSLH